MKSINPNLYPPDGYHYVESDGARIFGDTWNGVIARVASYRKRAGLPPGDPRAEVVAQACSRNPGYCVEMNDGVTAAQLQKSSLKSRILKWLNEVRNTRPDQRPPGVARELAAQRATICAQCPHNTALPGGCASCAAAVKESRKAILLDRPIDARLNACVILGEDVAVAINFDLIAVENGALPPQCWRKRTL